MDPTETGQRQPPSARRYFVDEAGDPTLFFRKGKVAIGTEGCSQFFILGALDVRDPEALRSELEALRASLLADPYFAGVPSMQPSGNKTAIAFHAKDDVPEVRREVLRLLPKHDLHFFAAVADKQAILDYVRGRNLVHPEYRYKGDELYDFLTRRLFENLLHPHDLCEVCFARRAQADRAQALRAALEAAHRRSAAKVKAARETVIRVSAASPREDAALQAVDYFLWALQRLFEKGEERYVGLLWPAFSRVVDIHDRREKAYGTYYTQRRPLTAAALAGRLRI